MKIISIFPIFLFLSTLGFSQNTWIVDDDNTDPPWLGTLADPFQLIQDGIDAASDDDTVLVMSGIYLECIDYLGKAITVRSESRDPRETIIDAQFLGRAVTIENTDGKGETVVLDGLTITHGICETDGAGAGVYIHEFDAVLSNNIIRNNHAILSDGGEGGGVYCASGSSSPSHTTVFENNLIFGNYAGGNGGGIRVAGTAGAQNAILIFNTIADNTSYKKGGGLGIDSGGYVSIVNSILWSNSCIEKKGDQIAIWETGSSVAISYSDVQGGEDSVEAPVGTFYWSDGMISAWPDFVHNDDDYYYFLSQEPVQYVKSICVDAGDPGTGEPIPDAISGWTTSTDNKPDVWPVDMGYHYTPFFYDPVPDIKVNDQDHDFSVSYTQLLTVEISLNPGDQVDVAHDWWILVERDSSKSFWWQYPGNWNYSNAPICAHAGPLFRLSNFIIAQNTLPKGAWEFTFAVDELDGFYEATYKDTITVTVF